MNIKRMVNMDGLYGKLFKALKEHNKEEAVKISLEALEKERIDVIGLYERILSPILKNVVEEYKDESMLIWQEHVRSEIVTSIIENTYLNVLKERDKKGLAKGKKVMVLCPKFEEHIIGSRMARDIFTIAGYETIFIGANTPWETVLKAIEIKKPEFISISVTNFYNIIETKRTIKEIKNVFGYGIKFILAGNAFKRSKETYKEIGGDIYLESLKDIFSLER